MPSNPIGSSKAYPAAAPLVTLTCKGLTDWAGLFAFARKFASYFSGYCFEVIASTDGSQAQVLVRARSRAGRVRTMTTRDPDPFVALRGAFQGFAGAAAMVH